MRIFISYPREFEEFAKEIEFQLQDRHFDTFLDRYKLNTSPAWRVEIERQINKSRIFIILYDPGAAGDKTRYFGVELDRIREQLRNNGKHVIAVKFPGTTLKDLPPHLRCRLVIDGTTNEADHYWTDEVIRAVERWSTNIKRKQTQTYALPIAAILLLAGIVSFLLSGSWSTRAESGPWAVSKKTCEELLNGKQYDLWGSYAFIEESIEGQGVKATSRAGKWTPKSCERSSAPDGTYILNGEEETTQEVEVKINGKYDLVANARNESRSKLTIDKDGRLVDRRIFYEREGPFNGIPQIDYFRKTEADSKKYQAQVREGVDRYKKRVKELHEQAEKTMHCVPTRGKREDNREVVAFTCVIDPSISGDPKYTRVMMKHN